jgi:hypothetical protein
MSKIPKAFGYRLTALGRIMLSVLPALGAMTAVAETTDKPNDNVGCPFELSIQRVDQFVQGRTAELAGLENSLLQQMAAISAKAEKPGRAIRDQLSATDIEAFNRIRHRLIQLQVEGVKYSNFERDVHVIVGTLEVARLADLYEVSKTDLTEADPRRFYFIILDSLRIAQPRAVGTPRIDNGISCDPEAGLFFEESFNKQELGKRGMDEQRLVDLNKDIERLRTFYQLSYLRLNKEIDDTRATRWKGDTPDMPDSVSPAIEVSGVSMQQMWTAIVPYIDKQFPSEKTFEAAYLARLNAATQREHPTVKNR